MSLKHAVRPTLRLEHSWSCWQILQIFHYQQTWGQAIECLGLNHTWRSYGMRCFLSSIHEDTKIPMRRWLCILFEVTDNYNFHCLVSVFSKNVIKFKSPEQIHVSEWDNRGTIIWLHKSGLQCKLHSSFDCCSYFFCEKILFPFWRWPKHSNSYRVL